MKIMAIANQKGGCGKTTTAVNLSYALSLRNQKTLLIDMDPQHHASTALGYRSPRFTILNAFDNIIKEQEFNLKEGLEHRNVYLSVLPSEFELGALEPELSHKQVALTLMDQLMSQVMPGEYDYVVIDCPPNLGFLTLNAMKIADIVIVPFDSGIFSVMGTEDLKRILVMLSDFTGSMPAVMHLLGLYDILGDARKRFGSSLLNTVIRQNTHLREASAEGKSVFEHAPKANGSVDFLALTDEILQRYGSRALVPFSLDGHNEAQKVYVSGDFNGWQLAEECTLAKSANGWRGRVPLEQGTYNYKFVIDNSWVSDPRNPNNAADPHGGINSVLTV
jgi:chromosome partitioning protein